jgi:Fe2+ transport system protein B
MDEACRKGITIDHQELARELGVPVIPTVGRTSQGIGDLISATAKVCSGKGQIRPRRVVTSGPVAAAIEDLAQVIQTRCPALPSARWVAIRLLEGDARVDRAITAAELVPMSKDASTEILRRAQMLRHGLDIAFRDRFVETVFDDARRIANYTIQTAEGPVSDWDARCGAIFRLRPAGRGPLGPRQFDGGSGGAGRRRYGMCST